MVPSHHDGWCPPVMFVGARLLSGYRLLTILVIYIYCETPYGFCCSCLLLCLYNSGLNRSQDPFGRFQDPFCGFQDPFCLNWPKWHFIEQDEPLTVNLCLSTSHGKGSHNPLSVASCFFEESHLTQDLQFGLEAREDLQIEVETSLGDYSSLSSLLVANYF